jgi:hypothetical protein
MRSKKYYFIAGVSMVVFDYGVVGKQKKPHMAGLF